MKVERDLDQTNRCRLICDTGNSRNAGAYAAAMHYYSISEAAATVAVVCIRLEWYHC